MKITKSGRRSRAARTAAGATTLAARLPALLDATGTGARRVASALGTLPNPTLRWLAAGSVGLGTGLFLAGKPRLIIAAGMAPALAMGAAMVARPAQPVGPTRREHERTIEMTDEHTKGAISTTHGKLEEALGKLTGNRREQARGKVRQVQGKAQEGLGDVQDSVRGRKKTP